jgi:hypothetical protein
MSAYALNKMLREVNRNPATREAFFRDRAAVAANFDLTEEERAAVLAHDVHALYRLGVHGLILRPFTINAGQSGGGPGLSDAEYVATIRG